MSLPPDPPSTPKFVEIIPPGEEPGPIPYFPPPRKPGRLIAIAAVVPVVLIAGGLSLAWWLLGNQINTQIDAFAAQLEKQGGKLETGERSRAGFPFHPTVVLARPEIDFPPGAPGPWGWSGTKASVGVSLFSPSTIDIDFSGSGQLSIAPLGQSRDLSVDSKTATLRLTRNALYQKASAKIAALSIAGADGSVTDVDSASIDLTQSTRMPGDEQTQAYSAALQLSGLTLPADRTTPLGRTLAQLVMEAHVLGPLKPTFDEDAFRQWRDAGGTLQVPQFIARFGPLAISLDATFALDKEMQPIGAGTGRIQGFAPALDALAASQAIRLNDANTVKSFLSLLARPPAPGQEPELTAPLTIQEGKLSVGPVAVMKMPHVAWPSEKAVLPPREEPKPLRSAPDDDDTVTPYPRVDIPDGR